MVLGLGVAGLGVGLFFLLGVASWVGGSFGVFLVFASFGLWLVLGVLARISVSNFCTSRLTDFVSFGIKGCGLLMGEWGLGVFSFSGESVGLWSGNLVFVVLVGLGIGSEVWGWGSVWFVGASVGVWVMVMVSV